ncbi:YibE/F family protein [Companilactobacillus sp. DQM5]|uniref:YibE/F family protein n=1 Tax=Companilactobacillus sp. DQM5 TaxID=3463359 RepID=UPI0040586FAD
MVYLSLIVILPLFLVLKVKAVNFILSILINTLLIYILLILICDGFGIIASTIIFSGMILAVSIYLNVKNSFSADTSFKTSIIVIFILLLIIVPILLIASVQGFGIINLDAIEGMQPGNIMFQKLVSSIMVINTIGVISESSIAISEGIFENYELNKDKKRIFNSGMIIGSMILKTQITTLFLNLVSLTFPVVIALMRLNYGIVDIFNDKVVVFQIITILLCMIAVVITVPITSMYCNWRIKKS